MDVSNLTNYQLYELIQNNRLDFAIRKLANQEFDRRKLTINQIEQIVLKHDRQFQPDKDEPLRLPYKIFLIIFPFFIEIHSLIAGRYLAHNRKRKWKDYWFYLSLGYLFWTIAVILIGKLVFKHHN